VRGHLYEFINKFVQYNSRSDLAVLPAYWVNIDADIGQRRKSIHNIYALVMDKDRHEKYAARGCQYP